MMRATNAARWWLIALIDVGLLAASVTELLLDTAPAWSFDFVFGAVGVLAVILRHRMPWVAFALTLPALAITASLIPTLVTLFAVAERSRVRWTLVVASTLTAVLWLAPWDYAPRLGIILDAMYSAMFGFTPIVLGLLVQTRRDLAGRLAELTTARRVEREAEERQIVVAERARIAREMHDVVSHQVSLITVQAGALQVSAQDDRTADIARTIRALCVRTLDELRQMVGVLRASGSGGTSLTPQPRLSDLPALLTASGIDVELTSPPPADLPSSVQRALFRAVQEGLTNVHKHSANAVTRVSFACTDRVVVLTVENELSDVARAVLPGSGHGLIGLRERAELLGGSMNAGPTPNRGFRLQMTLPVTDSADAPVRDTRVQHDVRRPDSSLS